MKRIGAYLIDILIVCITISCSQDTNVSTDGEINEPEPYNLIDKVMMLFGNHDKSVEFCKYAYGLDQRDSAKVLPMRYYSYVIENDPDYWFAFYRKGVFEWNCKCYKKSYNDLMKAYSLVKDGETSFQWYGHFFNKSDVCWTIGGFMHSYANYRYNIKDSLFESKEEAICKAIEFYEEALTIGRIDDNKRESIYCDLAFAYADAGFYHNAREAMSKCQHYNSDFLNGYICELQGRVSEAIRNYESIVNRCETCSDERYHLANCYEKLGDEEKAVAYMKEAASLSNEAAIKWLKEKNIDYRAEAYRYRTPRKLNNETDE